MKRLLEILAESIRRNNPNLMEQYVTGIAEERREHKYPIGELHAILDIVERHLHDLVVQSTDQEVERNGLLALVDAAVDSARMVFSKSYVLLAAGKL